MHSSESRFPLDHQKHCLRVCMWAFFKPGNFTRWDSEGVKLNATVGLKMDLHIHIVVVVVVAVVVVVVLGGDDGKSKAIICSCCFNYFLRCILPPTISKDELLWLYDSMYIYARVYKGGFQCVNGCVICVRQRESRWLRPHTKQSLMLYRVWLGALCCSLKNKYFYFLVYSVV